jgi:predicted Zn-dependent protease
MGDLRACESDFTRALSRLERQTKFAEALAQSSTGQRVFLDRRTVSPSLSPRLHGVVFRAWGGGRWVEAATSALDTASIARAAEELATTLTKAGPGPDPPGVSSTLSGDWAKLPTLPLRDVGLDELISLGQDAVGWATSVPGIHDCQVVLGWADQERLYFNTAGARCHQLLCRVQVIANAIASENGRLESYQLIDGGLGGRDRLDRLSEESVSRTARAANSLLHAQSPPTGRMAVVLDPSVTGTFAHESFGHGTEADQFVRDRSYLKPLLGTSVAPECLTIVDDGTYPDAWGTLHFDDEGYAGHRTTLIDRGLFVGALHDRETAAAFHVPATGNSRRSDFLSRLYVRMTNTYVAPGDWSLEELIREAGNGVLLQRATSGIEDPQGGQMQLKVHKGRQIENGQLTQEVRSMALSGRVLDFLRSIRGVSGQSDFDMDPGTCGKGYTDPLPVASGGPYLLASAVVGPA